MWEYLETRPLPNVGTATSFARSDAKPGILAHSTKTLWAMGACRFGTNRTTGQARRQRHTLRVAWFPDYRDAACHRSAILRGSEQRSVRQYRAPYLRGLRARRRVRHHPQPLRFPPVNVQPPRRNTSAHDGSWVFVARDPFGISKVCESSVRVGQLRKPCCGLELRSERLPWRGYTTIPIRRATLAVSALP